MNTFGESEKTVLGEKKNPNGTGFISFPNPAVDGLRAALFKGFLRNPSICF